MLLFSKKRFTEITNIRGIIGRLEEVTIRAKKTGVKYLDKISKNWSISYFFSQTLWNITDIKLWLINEYINTKYTPGL